MYKIKDIFIQKLYRSDLSNFEQQILIELAFRCDEAGDVQGVYYKDIIAKIGCSTAQFYNVLAKLEEKEFIIADKSDYHGDWDITILDNDFRYDTPQIKDGKFAKFVNLNLEAFETEKFWNLKAGERRVLLYLTFRVLKKKYNEKNKGADENKKKNKLNYTSKINKYKTIAKEIGISKRACKEYINELVKAGFISVGNKIDINGKKFDVITLLASVLQTPCIETTKKGKVTSEKRKNLHNHLAHFVKTVCRRNKIVVDKLNLVNTSMLMLQYRAIAQKKGKDIYNIVTNAIRSLSQELSSKIVHCIIKELLNKDYNESILVF